MVGLMFAQGWMTKKGWMLTETKNGILFGVVCTSQLLLPWRQLKM